ncbi:hypothetical protein BpHYR1_013404, partial [Brachionus plicatilis]
MLIRSSPRINCFVVFVCPFRVLECCLYYSLGHVQNKLIVQEMQSFHAILGFDFGPQILCFGPMRMSFANIYKRYKNHKPFCRAKNSLLPLPLDLNPDSQLQA